MKVNEFYKIAYDTQYVNNNLHLAAAMCQLIVKNFPEEKEAGYAKKQLAHLESLGVDTVNLFDETKEKAQRILDGDTRNYLDMIDSMQQGTSGIEYRYEYKVVPVMDEGDHVDANRLAGILNSLGAQGWTLKSALTNDVSKGAGALLGLRTAVEETVLIFERRVKI